MASDGWLRGFLWHHKLTFRRVTTTGRELPSNTNALIAKFFADVNKQFDNQGVNSFRGKVINVFKLTTYSRFI